MGSTLLGVLPSLTWNPDTHSFGISTWPPLFGFANWGVLRGLQMFGTMSRFLVRMAHEKKYGEAHQSSPESSGISRDFSSHFCDRVFAPRLRTALSYHRSGHSPKPWSGPLWMFSWVLAWFGMPQLVFSNAWALPENGGGSRFLRCPLYKSVSRESVKLSTKSTDGFYRSPGLTSLFLDHVFLFFFSVFCSVHFYWGSAKNCQFFATIETDF